MMSSIDVSHQMLLYQQGTSTPNEEDIKKISSCELTNVYADLEFFQTAPANGGPPLFEQLFDKHFHMREGKGSSIMLRELFEHPTINTDILKGRQQATSISPSLFQNRGIFKECEPDMMWTWQLTHGDDEDSQTLMNSAYVSNWILGKFLNRSSTLVGASNIYRIFVAPTLGILTPITYVIVPYIVLRLKFKIPMRIRDYLQLMYKLVMSSHKSGTPMQRLTRIGSLALSLVLYFQGVFSNIQTASMLRRVCNSAVQRATKLQKFATTILDMWKDVGSHARQLMKGTKWESIVMTDPSSDEIWIAGGGLRKANCKKFIVSNYGPDLVYLRRAAASEKGLSTLWVRACALDALGALIDARMSISLQPSKFVDTRGSHPPHLVMKGLWYPGIRSAVTNDWSFTGNNRNAILTGPNAGGKSTLMKAVLVATLLAQTIGITSCKEGMEIQPFGSIASHINVPDSQKRGESLFQAEMERIKGCVDLLQNAQTRGLPALVVIDEIFSSTNPIEGVAGAYATARRIGSFKCALSIISTHYGYLTRLAKDNASEGSFRTFQMPVKISDNKDVKLVAHYRLKPGVSHQYVALEIMRNSGVDNEILTNAIAVKNDILNASKKKKNVVEIQ
jgi:MutS domain V